ncbi:hypothetical protein CCR75_000679 [Bremia lactucae]|uniref:G-patch domain-containing protein n=1 Tax=Bremia lactucae TaxID=4779 RepID=A0A976FFK0_BRELC|nr:hypothetical protein CCR75_000679 [Bremia lactucae]
MATSGGGLSNADFARMFRKESQQETSRQCPNVKVNAFGANDCAHDLSQLLTATQRHQQEEATANSTRDVGEPSKLNSKSKKLVSGLGFGSSSNASLIQGRSGLGSGVSLGADKKDAGAAGHAKNNTYVWEKHTTGFGTKMLAKMGFKGRLGKKEDGVSAVVEVKQRPAQMGMGFGDFVEASNLRQNRKLQRELNGESANDQNAASQDEYFVEDDTLWRKRKTPAISKKHKRAADLAQAVETMITHQKANVVVDMRGPSVRVLTNVTAASDVNTWNGKVLKPKLGDELIYNVRMVVNLAEGKICDLSQKIDIHRERLAGLKKEAKMMKTQLDMNDVHLQHMQEMVKQIKALDQLREEATESQSVGSLMSLLRCVRRSFPLEFDAHKLQQLVPSICMPILQDVLKKCDLLDEASSGKVVIQLKLIHEFLNELPSSRGAKDATKAGNVLPIIREKTMAEGSELYNFILEETLWPAMMQCINVNWHAKSDPASCIKMFLQFRPHLSTEFEDAFLSQLVLLRLKKECQRWNPQSDAIPIHEWLLPWLPFLDAAMASLYPDIRLVLANALNNWHPSDLSVLAVLTPWRDLWGEREYAKFTHRHIVQKLIRCLRREFQINPKNQSLHVLRWVLAWKDLLPNRQLVALFEGEFFPKWLKALHTWVSGSPDLLELEKWYCGWKLFFESNCLATNARLRIHFHGALVLIKAATESIRAPAELRQPIPNLSEKAAMCYQDALALARDVSVEMPSISSSSRDKKTPPRSASCHSVSLKDVIENLAISYDLKFVPKGVHNGQQVYAFGKHQIILEQGVVFARESKGSFNPVDLEQLL